MSRLSSTITTAVLAAMIAGGPVFADSPAGKEIVEVIVQGNRIHTREQIVAQIDTRSGGRYDPRTALEDVNRLLALGWFPPSGIGVSTQVREDGKVIVYFTLNELQNTIKEIVYRGAAHLSKDELEKLTNLKVGAPMNPAVVQQARHSILRKYEEQGRHWATVAILEGNNERDTRVFFDIAEGPKTKIGGIDFSFFGPSSGDISTGRLRVQITSSRAYLGTLIGGDFSPVLVEQDAAKIGELYHNIGYLDVRVQRELAWSQDNRTVKIIFHIEEGPRYKVAKIQIDGSKDLEEAKLLGYANLHIGDYYSQIQVKADQELIKNFYGYRGYLVRVNETVHQAGDALVNVHYQIEKK
jgi:outer membrane protein insertion porin family